MRFANLKPAVGFCSDLFPDGSGRTWSFPTVLGNLLREAENRFGPREKSWTILGVEFGESRPHIWYPGECKHISIVLSESSRLIPERAIFQLAHEVIHLLSPTGRAGAPVIEEGVATMFCEEVSRREGLGFYSDEPEYRRALALVEKMMAEDRTAILKLRSVEPAFERMTPDHIRDICPWITPADAISLCEPFAVSHSVSRDDMF